MKGQSSMEFMMMISLSMIILAALTTVMAAKQQDTMNFQSEKNAEFIAEKTSFQVEMALVQGDGYSRVFSLPGTVSGENYTVEVGQGGVTVDWGDGSIYRLSRYQGDRLSISASSDSRVFRVKHNETGVFLVEI